VPKAGLLLKRRILSPFVSVAGHVLAIVRYYFSVIQAISQFVSWMFRVWSNSIKTLFIFRSHYLSNSAWRTISQLWTGSWQTGSYLRRWRVNPGVWDSL